MRKRWAERSFAKQPSECMESPFESPIPSVYDDEFDRDPAASQTHASDDLGLLVVEQESADVRELGASAKSKPTKRSKVEFVDATREASSGSAAAINTQKFDSKTFNHAKLKVAEYGKEVVDAFFGVKSPNTLLKRYYSVNSFVEWCMLEMDSAWLPLDEKLVWMYVRHLKLSQAPPTKPASFLESLRFCWFVLGTDGGQEVLASFRVRGLSAQMFSRKKEWQPADILTVDEVKRIHAFMDSEANNLTDRVIAGHLLHMLYVRARWSDLLAVQQAFIDSEGVYFELVTRAHKGAKGADAKSKLLPLVAPCFGVTGNWTDKYMELREKAGLHLPELVAEPMLLAPSAGGEVGWSSRPMSSEEGSEFLRRVIGVEKSPERRISSHSLKSTSMSWTSKYGLNFEPRALLARHVSAVSNPTAVYSRDLLSPVLRAFSEVVMKIGGHAFEPDKTRSGMITPSGDLQAPSTPWMSRLFTADPKETMHEEKDDLELRRQHADSAPGTPWSLVPDLLAGERFTRLNKNQRLLDMHLLRQTMWRTRMNFQRRVSPSVQQALPHRMIGGL